MKKLFLLLPFLWACNKAPEYNPERNFNDIEKELTTKGLSGVFVTVGC